jgi:hypothetical protein
MLCTLCNDTGRFKEFLGAGVNTFVGGKVSPANKEPMTIARTPSRWRWGLVLSMRPAHSCLLQQSFILSRHHSESFDCSKACDEQV